MESYRYGSKYKRITIEEALKYLIHVVSVVCMSKFDTEFL